MLSEIELREIEARCDAAAPPPWSYSFEIQWDSDGDSWSEHTITFPGDEPDSAAGRDGDSMSLACYAREDIPFMVELCRRLEAGGKRPSAEESERLARIRRHLEGTAALPWFVVHDRGIPSITNNDGAYIARLFGKLKPPPEDGIHFRTAEFIAHCKEDTLRLLEHLATLTGAR
jgi:hypothetical protein